MKMEQTQCSETSAFKLQTPVNHLEKAYNEFCWTVILQLILSPHICIMKTQRGSLVGKTFE
jgi:hypothetical protein